MTLIEKEKIIQQCLKNVPTHNWLVHKIFLNYLYDLSKDYARGDLVDIGCSVKPWQPILSLFVERYIGVDHLLSDHDLQFVDVVADAYNTTLPDDFCDTILCTMVLEHLERPWDAVKEMYRVVKPGGHVLLTTPLFWHLHEEPRDFYRYTKYGLQYLFETEGFETVLIQPMSGFVVTFTQEFIYILNMFKKSKKTRIFKPIIHVLQFLLQSIAYSINKWDMSHRFTWAYFVVARKKSQAL